MSLTPPHTVPAQPVVPRGWPLPGVVRDSSERLAAGTAAAVARRTAPARAAQVGGLLVAMIGATALAGWLTGSRLLASGGDQYIPVAPNTAVAFIMLGVAQVVLGWGPRPAARLARAAAALVLLVAGIRLGEYVLGLEVGVDHWLFSFPSESLGLAPVGRMAFFTALGFVLAGSATLGVTARTPGRFTDDLARACALVTTLIGVVFILGYAYGSPLLYGGRSIPMALPTAAGFLVLGLSITVPLILRAEEQRRQAETALRAAHDQLERRVSERTAELEEANEELQVVVVELEERTQESELSRQEAVATEQRYRTLVDGVAIGVLLVTREGIQAANPSAERIFGVPRDELRGRGLCDPAWRPILSDGSPCPSDAHAAAVALRTGDPQRNVIMGIHRPDGALVWLEVSADPVRGADDSAPEAAVTSFVDLTDRRRAEEALRNSEAKLRQAQKMEAIGQLAGGVAHDFNNMLTAIKSYAQLAVEAGDLLAARQDMVEVVAAADRAATLTRQLLAFSRKQLLQPEVLDLNEVTRNFEKLLARLIGGDVEVETRLAPDLCAISADPSQIEQVLMNLAVNSRDAMPAGGQLTIETAHVDLDSTYAQRYSEVTPGRYVMLAVSDTGNGMDSATQERIFEPFFTTKEPGQGTGLGLSTVYGIVKQSGGHVAVYSEQGCGTTFRVYFPCRDEPAPLRSAVDAAPPHPAQRTGTVLLVEDDPSVRTVTARILARGGYVVLEAPSPGEAEAIAARHPGPIQLILTDLVMPGMSGRELAQRLLLSRPGTPVLYMSGYTDDAVIRRGLLQPGMAFLAKPFAVGTVLRTVGEVIDGAGSGSAETSRGGPTG